MPNLLLKLSTILVLFFFTLTLSAQDPRALRLGIQTTDMGLIMLADTTPTYTPIGLYESWAVHDTVRNEFWLWNATLDQWEEIGGSLDFDGNRSILRTPSPGDNLGTQTVTQWLEWWYFTPPGTSLSGSPSTTVFEIGTSTQIIYSGSTSNPGGATLSNGYFRLISPSIDTLVSFGASTSYSDTIVFAPLQTPSGVYTASSYTFRANQSWVFGSESGVITSPNRSVTGVYPVLYGMSSENFADSIAINGIDLGTDPYTSFSKLVQTEGNKAVSFTGTNEYIYYFIPKTWSDFNLSIIRDHNEFVVTPSFTAYDVTVTSIGLLNNYVNVPYKMYKLNTLTTANGFEYDFIR